MVPQTKYFGNISEKYFWNIYETGLDTKFDEMDPDTNFFDNTIKLNFETSYFGPKKVKPYLQRTKYLEKLNVLHVNVWSIKHNFEDLITLMGERELVFHIICVSEKWLSYSE